MTDLFHQQGMVRRQLVDALLANQITTAVADVGDAQEIIADACGRAGRTHTFVVDRPLSGFVDHMVGDCQAKAEPVGFLREPFIDNLAGMGGQLPEISRYATDGDGAGLLSGLVAPHAVSDDKETEFAVDTKCVLVVRADFAPIGQAGQLYGKLCHRRPKGTKNAAL
jgi:hypothetical protein